MDGASPAAGATSVVEGAGAATGTTTSVFAAVLRGAAAFFSTAGAGAATAGVAAGAAAAFFAAGFLAATLGSALMFVVEADDVAGISNAVMYTSPPDRVNRFEI